MEHTVKAKPFNWDVVIPGYWNRAILTPNGIAKRLFNLGEGAGIEVYIPVDLLGSPQVKHDGIVVKVDGRLLVITAQNSTYESLHRAMEIGCNALNSLPETPVLAAGFNIRYKIDEYEQTIDKIMESNLDDMLSDARYNIISKGLKRTVRFADGILKEGTLNFKADRNADGITKIELNFHKDSKKYIELVKWLSVSPDELKMNVQNLLTKVVGVDLEETDNADNG